MGTEKKRNGGLRCRERYSTAPGRAGDSGGCPPEHLNNIWLAIVMVMVDIVHSKGYKITGGEEGSNEDVKSSLGPESQQPFCVPSSACTQIKTSFLFLRRTSAHIRWIPTVPYMGRSVVGT